MATMHDIELEFQAWADKYTKLLLMNASDSITISPFPGEHPANRPTFTGQMTTPAPSPRRITLTTPVSIQAPVSPSPSLRYDADDEAPAPLADTSNHTRRPTDPSKLTGKLAVTGPTIISTRSPATALKDRLRHREIPPTKEPAPPPVVPVSVASASRRLAEAQLAEAMKEAERLRAHTRTLEGARAELAREVEVLRARPSPALEGGKQRKEREEMEDKCRKAEESAREERVRRERAEVECRRLRGEVAALKAKCEEVEMRAKEEIRRREAVEGELDRLALEA
ncbi:hypothetical protein K488DRAFT_90837 [Vararia minispora EC-137]|uniref:Uncharacterized protein n=1 Tax=Vararia minispora EC-137 TaxID=1314806 RepID=A0ACB8Q6Q3_9AGAM|nr:hypothetical protein K488DRAFT_90837 [Vararia minispora EC-137]